MSDVSRQAPANIGIGSWPGRRARIDPTKIALRQGDRTLTYRELSQRVETLAGALAARGVGPGERVAHVGPNDIATFELLFATTLLGGVFVPLNARLTGAELDIILEDCRPLVLAATIDVPAGGLSSTSTSGWAAVPTVVVLGVPAEAPRAYEALFTGAPTALPPSARVAVSLDHEAVILYTSGTTGRPKGVMLTHGNITFNTMNQLAHADVLSSDVALCLPPIFHATGLGQVSLPTLFKGGTVIVVPKVDAATVLSLIESEQVNAFSAVPTILQMLSDHTAFAATDLGSLRYVIYGGSPVVERVAVTWQRRGVHLQQGYGMTEAAPGVFLAPVQGAVDRPTSIGVPHFFTDVAFDCAGTASPGTGELLVRGPHVFRGYWENATATNEAFEDGWYRSGDILRVDEDGWAYVVDRVRNIYISGGENVSPAEVEAAIAALPGVQTVAVVAVPDERWGEVGHAFVVMDGSPQPEWTAESLRKALRGVLAGFKVPHHVTFTTDLPMTASGKVQKSSLHHRGELP